MTTNSKKFKLGTRIYYTGDMANMGSEGTIIKYRPREKYIPESVDIQYDEDRFDGDTRLGKMIPVIAFNPGPGCRFELI